MELNKTTKQSATACYAERQTECQDLLKRIADQLERHAIRQKQAPADWGYAGDLGRVADELAYVLSQPRRPLCGGTKRTGILNMMFSLSMLNVVTSRHLPPTRTH